MVDGTQFIVPLEMPTAIRKYALVSLCGDHFGEEQIIGVLDVRFGDDAAFQPGNAADDQRRRDLAGREGRDIEGGELVVRRFAQQLAPAAIADPHHHLRLCATRHVNGKGAGGFHQFARVGVLVDDDGDLGRVEIQRHVPGGCHDVAVFAMGGGDEDGGTVVEEAVGYVGLHRS